MLLESEQLMSLHAGTGEVVSRREREIPYLLGDAPDLQFLEGVGVPEVAQRLEAAAVQADALHLALILLDPELPHDVRRDAADELAELLEIEDVREHVEGVLLSHPLPREADPTGALYCCPGRAAASRKLLLRLQSLQSKVHDVFLAWERISVRTFGEERDRAFALATAVREGFFRQAVLLRAERKPVDELLSEALRNPAFSRARNHREILREWLEPLRAPEAPGVYPVFDRSAQFVAELREDVEPQFHGLEETPSAYDSPSLWAAWWN
jgi:hypothetical protein